MDMAYNIILGPHVPNDISNLIAEIDEFKGHWEVLQKTAPDRLSILRKVATIASIGSSTRIEGARLSDTEVEQLLSSIGTHSFKNRDEEEVAGYADAMNRVFDFFQEIPITENHIKQLHQILLKYSGKDKRHKGDYKKLPNHIEAFDPTGKSVGIVFETATPFQTPFFMTELIEWYHRQIQDKIHHPLLVIAGFTVHFLAIHPFQDGNGRLSRILTTLMLLKQGYTFVPYCSLESIVEENKARYYLSLRKAQSSFKTDHAEMVEWQRFWMSSLKKQKDLLLRKLEQEKSLSMADLSDLEAALLEFARLKNRFVLREAVAQTQANRNTVKKYLQRLVKKGYLKKHGIGKGTWYFTA
ncbi:MAG: AsnC family transcriptional regulator [Elusimicrobia bacterium RIFOXYB2_FULL_49_7]|nr:MAG: AsnC family transcriptional regulator [Elusimicrobia bacterium RIFOXYB2_FULL_49_7]